MTLVAADTDVLFAEIGKALFASNLNNTANKTAGTIAAETEDFLQQVGLDASGRSTAILDAVAGAGKAGPPLLSAGQSYNTTVTQTPVQNLVVQVIKADSQQPNDSALTAIRELTRQMLVMAPVETLKANEPDLTPATQIDYGTDFNATSASSANTGDGIFNASDKRGDGKVNEHLIPEVIEGNISSISPNGQAAFQLRGEALIGKMSPDWPGGSGITTTITSQIGAGGANLVNGSFEVEDTNEADLAAGWISIVTSSTIGTTLDLTPIEVQTVEITDVNITGGYYTITHTDKDSNTQTTVPLVYNASGSAVQSALRNLNGLGEITITSAGTSPNLTHTVTFTGVTNPGALTVDTTNVTGGTPGSTVVTTTAGSASVMRGARAVKFTGNAGAELTSIAHPVTLQPATVYALSVWLKNDGTLAAGAMNIGLFDRAASGASAINDDQAVANEFASPIDLTALTATFTQQTAFFRTPTILPDSLFLRVRMTTAITNGEEVHMDELVLVPASELYPGGPFAAIFTGPTDWVDTDVLRFSPANGQIGLIHTWMDRIFDLSSNRLLLSSTTGAETILDSLIS